MGRVVTANMHKELFKIGKKKKAVLNFFEEMCWFLIKGIKELGEQFCFCLVNNNYAFQIFLLWVINLFFSF